MGVGGLGEAGADGDGGEEPALLGVGGTATHVDRHEEGGNERGGHERGQHNLELDGVGAAVLGPARAWVREGAWDRGFHGKLPVGA